MPWFLTSSIRGDYFTVLLDRAYSSSHIGSVVFDSHYAGYITAKHLINLGHRKIGFIAGASDVSKR